MSASTPTQPALGRRAAPGSAAPPRADDRMTTTEPLAQAFRRVRAFSEKLAEPLEPEDCVVQTMVDVSPTKWHLAHTSWFFDTFILQPHLRGFRPAAASYAYLFNSYYNAAGPMHCRDRRGCISRPTVRQTMEYRRYVDEHMEKLLGWLEREPSEHLAALVVVGINHEQQHQELMLTDIKHVFGQNPLHPVYQPAGDIPTGDAPGIHWIEHAEGVHWIGHEPERGFAFDNEGPCHRQFVDAFALADRLVTNSEYRAFIEDGGYTRPELWLSLGWARVQEEKWRAPLYWEFHDDTWMHHTLGGWRPVAGAEPVCHVSYFEADAYARWAGARLPTEAEWEVAAGAEPLAGNFVESGRYHPVAAGTPAAAGRGARQIYGDVWEWTRSAYLPYPGYAPARGALGEYNGKFMCNQMVLRGGSCATSRTHIRPTYRNFFAPEKRWQFTGIRLARGPS